MNSKSINRNVWALTLSLCLGVIGFSTFSAQAAERKAVTESSDKTGGGECCQFEVMVTNALPNIAKIKITPTNSAAVNYTGFDGDPEYFLQKVGSGYEIKHVDQVTNLFDSIPVVLNAALDLDLTFDLNPSMSTNVTIQWLDSNNALKKQETVPLSCKGRIGNPVGPIKGIGKAQSTFTTAQIAPSPITSTISKGVTTAFAEKVECEMEPVELASVCGFTNSFSCGSNNQNILGLTANDVSGATYAWQVDSTSYSTQTVSHPVTQTGDTTTAAYLDVTYPDPSSTSASIKEECSREIAHCLPRTGLTAGTPQPQCTGNVLNGFNVQFTPEEDLCSTAQYVWNFGNGNPPPPSSGIPQPTTNSPLYPAPPVNGSSTYNVSLDMTDSYGGCHHIGSTTVPISGTCDPKFKAEYYLCPRDIKPSYSVNVHFTNLSTSYCGTAYTWDFGDSNTLATAATTVTHTYSGLQSDLPKTYNVKLSMTDSTYCSTTPKVYTLPVKIEPVPNILDIDKCSTGTTYFDALEASCPITLQTATVVWDKVTGPASTKLGKCNVNVWLANQAGNKTLTCDELPSGNYTASETAIKQFGSSVKAMCKATQPFNVLVECCTEFKYKASPPTDRSFNSKDYRMKNEDRLKERFWFIPGSREKGKTKFKVRKTFLGISYWPGVKSNGTIEVNWLNGLRGPGTTSKGHTCDCATQNPPQFFDVRTNKKKAKFSQTTGNELALHNQDLFQSRHLVQKGGKTWTIIVEKPAGGQCDVPNISSDTLQ